jgi:hypothetical protein
MSAGMGGCRLGAVAASFLCGFAHAQGLYMRASDVYACCVCVCTHTLSCIGPAEQDCDGRAAPQVNLLRPRNGCASRKRDHMGQGCRFWLFPILGHTYNHDCNRTISVHELKIVTHVQLGRFGVYNALRSVEQ